MSKIVALIKYSLRILYIIQQKKLNSNINISMKKVQTKKLTAGMLSENFDSTDKSFIAKDEGYCFMDTIKGTLAY